MCEKERKKELKSSVAMSDNYIRRYADWLPELSSAHARYLIVNSARVLRWSSQKATEFRVALQYRADF